MVAFKSSSVEQSDVGSCFYESTATNEFSTESPENSCTIEW